MKRSRIDSLTYDQIYFNNYFENFVKEKKLTVRKIPIHIFGIGLNLFGKYFFTDFEVKNDTTEFSLYLVHFNYMAGIDQKDYYQKELLFWNYDKNEYYTSIKNKYLMISFQSNSFDDEELYLKKGLELSLELNRIFILPKFSCKYCEKVLSQNLKCHYITYFSIRSLNTYYGINNYRENVLFTYNSRF